MIPIDSSDSPHQGAMNTESQMTSATVDETKYVQQHLANERTFLAWIRTVVSIVGVGFVTTTIHFEMRGGHHVYADLLTKIIGLSTLVLAIAASTFAAVSYLAKRRGINALAFRATGVFVVFVSLAIVVILLEIAVYMAFAY
ncbi:hypothetical protein AAC03nite_25650 [Alicyclobacillus acidoterrestris]|uniref:YidH family protein n=1 Tax=Alicyclobacillus suci TaxID=2816080 RepID=UPI00118EF0B2|nr:DUF202 domain-containing protein [Alicyclobacillus suci]GEO26780.1 hypothetical protein AAC03nite_25650 [Alicyclobacillus acidoterrestris]